MKLSLVTLSLLVGIGVSAQTYQINTDESVVNWKGEKIVGSSQMGTLQFSEGTFKVKNGVLVSGDFIIDMTTIADKNGSKKLDGHLKSDDFFGVKTYPTASLVIKSSEEREDGSLVVTADLTIKAATEEITFTANVSEDEGTFTGSAELTFDRSKFDVRYGSNSFFDDLADKAISDDIKLNIKVMASK
ncbi:MAG: YceI family protein [Cytophagales bacterium]|nr:YceI family protein [Cytophagales bacterium]